MAEQLLEPAAPPMDAGAEPAPEAPESEMEEASVFLSKESLGGKTYKAGDTITLTVTDVDPETGDVQADLSEGGETSESSGGYSEDFDNAMPDQGEGVSNVP